MFGRATIRLGIGPHSSSVINQLAHTLSEDKFQLGFVTVDVSIGSGSV